MIAAISAGSIVVYHLVTAAGQVAPACTVSSGSNGTAFQLDLEQGQNASIIAAVGLKLGLPDHAVTVALATAMQESKLQNLTYGDLDSVGLFQQRPSQGWGTRDQLLDPVYATTAFYNRLVHVPGWETMAVTDAAQAVQHSGDPTAYAQWETEARAFAIALTGEAPEAFTCHLAGFSGSTPASGALTAASSSELGSAISGTTMNTKQGWAAASWVVAHAWEYHVHQVSFGGWTWKPQPGTWTQTASNPALNGQVSYS